MARDILNVDTSFVAAFRNRIASTSRIWRSSALILHGTSVLDWHRLDLPDLDQVDSFLATHRIDWNNAGDRERVRFVFNQAINYLEEHHAVHFPKDLRDPDDLRTLFLEASTYTGRVRKRRALACMLLKLMHTINHMDAADLKHRAPVPEAELLDRAEKVIVEHADGMREQGLPLLAFYGSRKTRTSVITKLLSKRDSIAATIFDKLRFRVVVETQREILPVIAHLTRTLFPFNYVIPNASHNTLVNWRKAQKDEPHYAKLSGRLQRQRLRPGDWLTGNNPFSGSNYRVLNFIVDFPVRVDDLMSDLDPELRYMLGSTVYVMVEFQVVDKTTAEANELGENAHSQYKTRQRKTVETRLLRGSLSKLR